MNGRAFELTVGAAEAQYWIMSLKKEKKEKKSPPQDFYIRTLLPSMSTTKKRDLTKYMTHMMS